MIRAVLLSILLLAVAWAFWRLVDGVIEVVGGAPSRGATRRRSAAVKLVRDPVCGTWVAPSDARCVRAGSTTHYFCSEECRNKFQGQA